jgi:hypothetical protein
MQDQFGLLHSHPGMEMRKGLDKRHVVVDQPEWRAVRSEIAKLPLTADKVVVWPGDTVLRAGVGEVYVYTVTTVGLDGYIQVTHADGSGGEWALVAAELYGCIATATRVADENQAHFDARKAALHLGGQATLGDVTRAEAILTQDEAWAAAEAKAWEDDQETAREEAWAEARDAKAVQAARVRDAERATRRARKDERETREARVRDAERATREAKAARRRRLWRGHALGDVTCADREAALAAGEETREALAAYWATIKAMSERQAERKPAIWPIDLAEMIHADREAEALQADPEAQDAGRAAQVYARWVGRGLCQGWAGEEAPWDR